MSISHRWFRSGSYSLIGHIHIPRTQCGQLGVVVVPPLGWEDICSYRSLRFLGQTLAENGIPVIRFDLPGTGDSSGSATDSGLFDAWIQSIGDAATELRAATGIEDVTVVGIRLGAMLAAAAARGANLQDLILWGPALTGRALLRELRAFQKMELMEYVNGDAVPSQPIAGLEICGFLISPETQTALESFDLAALPRMQGRRLMVVSRDDFPPEDKVVGALMALGCTVEVRAGSCYAGMMAPPHEAVHPTETVRALVEFVRRDLPEKRRDQANNVISTKQVADERAVTVIDDAGTSVLETIYTIERSSDSIFGIFSEPGPGTPRTDLCLLFLNPGAARHIGPNRIWVEAARRWAARGVASLRMDFAGIGESDGESYPDVASLYQGQFLEQVQTAMDSLRSRAGARRFAVIGLCSGAFWAFHAAINNPEIRGTILLNPRLFFWDPEVDRRRMLRRTINGLADSTTWRRLASGKIKAERIKQAVRNALDVFHKANADGDGHNQIPAEAMAHSLAAIERYQSRLTLIFTEGEPLLREMEQEAQLPPENSSLIRCIRIPNAGHTFRPLWSQKLVHDLIDRDLDLVLRESLQVLKEHAVNGCG